MRSAVETKKGQALEKIYTMLEERLPKEQAQRARKFASQYYAGVAPEDVLDSAAEDLYGSMLAHWNFARHRVPKSLALRVYNPSYEEHGWQSTHTVVELVVDDMPFLVDSTSMELVRQGLTVHLIVHPVMQIRRAADGELQEILEPGSEADDSVHEAVMRFEVDRQTDPQMLHQLPKDLERVLTDVHRAVEDWPAMTERLGQIIDHIEGNSPHVSADEHRETLAFLRWAKNHHFTFLGCRTYDLVEEQGEDVLRSVPGSGLGMLRDQSSSTQISRSFSLIPPELRARARVVELLVISKSTARSTVHRPAHLDYIGIKRFDDDGNVVGEWRFLGLYTSAAYTANPRSVPLLRNKVERVMTRSQLVPNSHAGKALLHVLDGFPRDEMFQATEDELLAIGLGIVQVQERHRLRLFIRKDLYSRFVSALIYVPRDRYNTLLRVRMQDMLMEAFRGKSSEFNVQFSELIFARVHFIIQTEGREIGDHDVIDLEARMAEAMLSWEDELLSTLREQTGEERGNHLFNLFGHAFSAAYRDDFSVRTTALDIQRLEKLESTNRLSMQLYQPLEGPEGLLRFKVYGRNRPMALSDVLPMLERMGLRVLGARPYEIENQQGDQYWILDFDMTAAQSVEAEVLEIKEMFQDAFQQVWDGQIENDGFNRLVLIAGIPSRDVVTLRAVCKYLLQAGIKFSQTYMESSLANNPHIARLLVDLYHARLNPERESGAEEGVANLVSEIENALEAVLNLDEDRILRRYLATINAILRTNFFQADESGQPKSYLSFKLDPARVPELPLPLPMFEIFVYSPRVEGVHLRGGLVARGGLRWSDRMEDFRTEVLGLMKAQMVKNAVIVPVGSKGGFVCKRLPGGDNREALQQEVIANYKTFIRGLLDITDNLEDGRVVTPSRVVRYDGDDPYLVVAADKGTATFSDIANGLSEEYGFWLGDAFASGGSAGYDHKKMGITARGAWESVKRSFRELGLDTQNEVFTVAGIGDMSGDVFGNGMLLSRKIKLLAAFNHMHIFIDPDPDPEASFEERQRIFDLPRSSWESYDKALISKGGGIYSRRAKSIALSPEARKMLTIDAATLTPSEVVQAILKAPVDLLWNGGIGTYVKSSAETHTDVGDKTNDAVRVNATDLHCRVIGEGGNLGLTQRGRIEFARRGGYVSTDAIDNSGGVDCSDHEVNIKILLNQVFRNGDMTIKQRNQLLVEMTDEVASLVLRHNYLQTQAISVTSCHAREQIGDHNRLMRELEHAGRLNRELEFLPGEHEITERSASGEGLTRPEISVLLAYAKIRLFDELLASDIAEDPYLSRELQAYFPERLQSLYANLMNAHPLRREIIATHITNSMVNRMGSTFGQRLHEMTGEASGNIARAYTVAREIFGGREIWAAIESLDNQVPASIQLEMMAETRRLLDRGTLWFLRNRRQPIDIAQAVEQFGEGVKVVGENLPSLLTEEIRNVLDTRAQHFIGNGVPEWLAMRVAGIDGLYSALDIADVARTSDLDIIEVARTYYTLAITLDLPWLLETIRELPSPTHWQQQARTALRDELYAESRVLTAQVLRLTEGISGTEARIQAWIDGNRVSVEHCRGVFADLQALSEHDLAMVSVAVREVKSLSQ